MNSWTWVHFEVLRCQIEGFHCNNLNLLVISLLLAFPLCYVTFCSLTRQDYNLKYGGYGMMVALSRYSDAKLFSVTDLPQVLIVDTASRPDIDAIVMTSGKCLQHYSLMPRPSYRPVFSSTSFPFENSNTWTVATRKGLELVSIPPPLCLTRTVEG